MDTLAQVAVTYVCSGLKTGNGIWRGQDSGVEFFGVKDCFGNRNGKSKVTSSSQRGHVKFGTCVKVRCLLSRSVHCYCQR